METFHTQQSAGDGKAGDRGRCAGPARLSGSRHHRVKLFKSSVLFSMAFPAISDITELIRGSQDTAFPPLIPFGFLSSPLLIGGDIKKSKLFHGNLTFSLYAAPSQCKLESFLFLPSFICSLILLLSPHPRPPKKKKKGKKNSQKIWSLATTRPWFLRRSGSLWVFYFLFLSHRPT